MSMETLESGKGQTEQGNGTQEEAGKRQEATEGCLVRRRRRLRVDKTDESRSHAFFISLLTRFPDRLKQDHITQMKLLEKVGVLANTLLFCFALSERL